MSDHAAKATELYERIEDTLHSLLDLLHATSLPVADSLTITTLDGVLTKLCQTEHAWDQANWIVDIARREADTRDERATLEDVRNGGCL